ncbi:MAG: 2-isopropylmalate synthase [Elusimicrobiota bacterium]
MIIFDTTLRDGEQSPGASLNIERKLEIARQLQRLGVDIIEAGFPVSSQGDFESVSAIAKNVKGPVIAGLARTLKKDIDICARAISHCRRRRIHTFIATSDIHLKYKLKKTRDEVLDIAGEAVKYARRFTPDVEFSAEDAVRSDFEFLCRVIERAIENGATTINVPDTVGYALPEEFGMLIKNLRENVRGAEKVIFSVHCHNDLGLAVANSIYAIVNGARQVECTINGIGERAGNASLEELIMAMRTRWHFFKKMGISIPAIDTRQIYKTSRLVSSLTGIPVQPNKAIVGSNAFAHEAGIHQDGVLKKRQTYEIMTPQSVGIPSSTLVLGKHSGRHAFSKRLGDMGFKLSSKKTDELFAMFKNLADRKKYVFDSDIISLIEEKLGHRADVFSMEYFSTYSITPGPAQSPKAVVCLKVSPQGKKLQSEKIEETALGDGPVDAAYKAIDKIVKKVMPWKKMPKLLDFSLKSISIGKDAQGEATIKVEYDNFTISGRGTSTDIIEASIKSYLDVLNKIAAREYGKWRHGL